MSRKVRVPVHGKALGTATVEDGATEGAIVGVNLRTRDGRIIQESDLGGGTTVVQQSGPGGGVFSTLWRLIREIPANIVALADLATTGLVARTGAGTFATRTVTGTSGRIGVTNGDGVSGDPTVDLATLADAGTGTFLKLTRDIYGRVSGTTPVVAADIEALSPDHGAMSGLGDDDHTQYHTDARALTWLGTRSTSDLPEGTNLYYTDERAQDAVGGMAANSTFVNLTYTDATPALQASLSATGTASSTTFLRGDNTWATPAGGVSDGDKGDITVSGSGATWTIDNNVVTFAKMQDIATDRLIGRDAAGSGDPTEISLNATLAWTGSNSFGINLTNPNSWTGAQTFSTVDINGGTIDSAVIGGTTPAAGSFTTLTASGDVTFSDPTVNIAAGTVFGVASGNNLPTFQALDGTSAVQFTLRTDSTNRRLIARNAAGTTQSQITLANDLVQILGSSATFANFNAAGMNNCAVGATTPAAVTGTTVRATDNSEADTAFLVNNVHALTDVTTAGQTRTLDLSNGAVQTISANQDFTLDVSGPAGKAGFMSIYVYNSSGSSFFMSHGAGWFEEGINATSIDAGDTRVFMFFWDGYKAVNHFNNAIAGDQRPT